MHRISADDFDVLAALALRPIRPKRNWRNGNDVGAFPARHTIKHKSVIAAAHAAFSAEIRLLAPEQR
jgi:hypothetical protein